MVARERRDTTHGRGESEGAVPSEVGANSRERVVVPRVDWPAEAPVSEGVPDTVRADERLRFALDRSHVVRAIPKRRIEIPPRSRSRRSTEASKGSVRAHARSPRAARERRVRRCTRGSLRDLRSSTRTTRARETGRHRPRTSSPTAGSASRSRPGPETRARTARWKAASIGRKARSRQSLGGRGSRRPAHGAAAKTYLPPTVLLAP